MAKIISEVRIWFLFINGVEEGPFTKEELSKDRRISLKTLVWREGFEKWMPIIEIPELKDIFEQEPENSDEEDEKEGLAGEGTGEELVLDTGGGPNLFLLFLLAAVLLATWLIWDLFG